MIARLENSFENISKEKWNVLLQQSDTNTVFQTYEWHYSWWKIYGETNELFLVCIEDENNLIALAPLMICTARNNKRILRFVGHGRSDYSDFIFLNTNKKILGLIFDLIMNHSDKWDEIDLNRIPGHSMTTKVINDICNGKNLYCIKHRITNSIALNIKNDPDFIKKVLKKKSLKYYQRCFVKKNNYRVLHLFEKREIKQYLERFFDQHVDRWRSTDTQSIFREQHVRDFYRELTLNMSDNKWVVLSVIESEGSPIAFHFGFLYCNTLVYYKPTFDITLFKFSPGQVLLKELLDFAVSNNLHEFDFTVGDESYKRRFSNVIREIASFRIVKSFRTYWFYNLWNLIKKNRLGNLAVDFTRRIQNIYIPEAVGSFKRDGCFLFTYKLLSRLIKRFVFNYNCVLFFEIPASVISEEMISPEISEVDACFASIKDLYEFDCFSSEYKKEKFLVNAFDRFRKGDKCLIAQCSGQIIYVSWISEKEDKYLAEVKTNANIGENSIFIYNCTTTPEYRGKKIYTFMLNRTLNLYNGKKRTIFCNKGNIASKKGIFKAGFTLKKKYYLLSFLGINIRWQKPVIS